MNEFELIKYLTKDSPKKRKDIIYSIGDDAADYKYTCGLLFIIYYRFFG